MGSPNERPNVVLVSLDTVRADVAYSGAFPELDRLASRAARFRRAFSVAPITPVSHASILTGLLPARHGIRHLLREQLRPEVETLAGRLADEGYATGAVVSAAPLNRWYGLGRGFSEYDDQVPKDPDPSGKLIKRADDVVRRGLAWTSRVRRRPFFLLVHFFDAHWPYGAPGGAFRGSAYEGEVAYLAQQLAELDAGLRAIAGGEIIFVVFADHGEDLAGEYPNDHAGMADHPEEAAHGCLLFDATQHVPFWIDARGLEPRDVHWQVSLVDLTPTVLELLGLDAAGLDGRSLLPLLGGDEESHRVAYSETYHREERAWQLPELGPLRPLKAVRVDDAYKLVWETGAGAACRWYDLAADPEERRALELAAAPAALRTRFEHLRAEYAA